MDYEVGVRLDAIIDNQKMADKKQDYIIKVFDDNGIKPKEEEKKKGDK